MKASLASGPPGGLQWVAPSAPLLDLIREELEAMTSPTSPGQSFPSSLLDLAFDQFGKPCPGNMLLTWRQLSSAQGASKDS